MQASRPRYHTVYDPLPHPIRNRFNDFNKTSLLSRQNMMLQHIYRIHLLSP